MPKTARQLEKIKARRKEQIVLAGLKVFCEKGYEGAKVDDIVKKAGCSHGLFTITSETSGKFSTRS